ncbi:DNA repair protein RAD50 [Toxorhynchites rutilus septentrionalis]|uniref:DNA repair protein RAD50 n=1 Tax=Toxorhynchites rutilus septentrionalis TaxID=329112 RepID=UPI0024797DFE|nr:DNA repair protein RAD50 [Toxorhynchites rutilus septentrionalis]
MSTICKLEIRGIRSFGGEAEDVQKIKFQSPLTLIVGQNGCGKTTIIECLKYGLTGEFPPGTDRGKAFVHDPKIFNLIESMGQVKLMVKDFTGNRVTGTRSMKVHHKGNAKQLKFETVDMVVTMEDANGSNRTNISRPRGADINNDMCDAMGVSKAIINNVIFCHQEDSNWPLEEPKELKKKFDAIFGTTEYNRVTEKLIKISKEYSDRQKDKAGDLKLLENIKKQAEVKQLELQKAEQKKDEMHKTIEQLKESVKPIQIRLEQLAKVEREYSKLKQQKVEYKSKIGSKEDQQKQLHSKIRTIFDGTLAELEIEIRNFQLSMSSKHSDLRDAETDLNSRKAQEKQHQAKLQDCETRRVQLVSKRGQEQDLSGDRGAKIVELREKLKLPCVSSYEAGGAEVQSALKEIKGAIGEEEKGVLTMGKEHDEADHRAQRTIDSLREEKTQLETDVRMKKQMKSDFALEKARIQSDIANIQRSAEKLKELVADIEKHEKIYESQKANSNIDEKKREMAEKKVKREELQNKLDKAEEQISALDAIAVKATELGLKEQQFNGKEAEFRRVRNRHSANLKQLFPNRIIENNYKRNVQNLYDDLQRQIKQLNESIRKSQAVVTEKETTRRSQKRELDRMEKELTENKEKIYSACQGNPYEEVLAKMKEKIAKSTLEHGELRSAEVLNKSYISRIEDNQCCPVCDKEMARSDVQYTVSKLSDEMRQLPDRIEALERQLKTDREKYDRLLGLRSLSETIDKQAVEIPKLKRQLEETERCLTQASAELEEYQMSIVEPNSSLHMINSILGDMGILDESAKDLERMGQGIADLKKELAEKTPQGSSSSLEDIKLEREALRGELRGERISIDKLQNEIDEKTEKLNTLHQRYNQMKEKKLQLQESVQSLDQKKAKELELGDKIAGCQKEIEQAESKLGPVQSELAKEEAAKVRVKNENRAKMTKAQTALGDLKQKQLEIERLGRELDVLASQNLVVEIQKMERRLREIREAMKEISTGIEEKFTFIDSLKKEISNQDLIERDLRDNKDLKKLTAEIDSLKRELQSLKETMGNIDAPNVNQEMNKLFDQRDGIQARKSKITGQISQLDDQVEGLRRELNKPELKNALRNYQKTYCESVVLKKIYSDILKYRNALDWALMQYHKEKMEQINRSIYSLWRDIYRGNDIDYICIKTEDESKVDRMVEKRRTYSYRVVQAKNDVEIDMRGRCSAGQKVLASLIIRMALAETFSNNCGVMALDEPTTNLDRENIASLCESLRSIVTERENGNFLLIIITHDEEFVTKLERFETYYRISRDNNGKSVIKEERL